MQSPEKIIDERGDTYWMIGDKCHREDGPAIIRKNGLRAWLCNDLLHRTDGPAIEYPHGAKSWWIDGERYLCMDNWAKELGIYDTEEFVLLKLKYG